MHEFYYKNPKDTLDKSESLERMYVHQIGTETPICPPIPSILIRMSCYKLIQIYSYSVIKSYRATT